MKADRKVSSVIARFHKVVDGRLVLTDAEYRKHCSDMDGVCARCWEIQFGDVEQDTEERECAHCKEPTVMGFEQALITGYLDIEDIDEAGEEVAARGREAGSVVVAPDTKPDLRTLQRAQRGGTDG